MNLRTLLILLCMIPGVTAAAAAQDQILNYRDADLSEFIRDVALATRKTFIIDPEVRGKVNIVSSDPVNETELFETLLSVLRVNGMAAVPTSGGAYKITKTDMALQDGGPVNTAVTGDALTTRVFTVQHSDPLAVQAAIKPYVAKNGFSFARVGMPIVIVTDFADNLLKIAGIIESIDRDRSVVRTLVLRNSSATEMVAIAERLVESGEEDRSKRLSAIPVESSNTLILKGLPEVLDQLLPVLEDIDAGNANRGDLRVVRLKNADAETLLPVLEGLTRSVAGANAAAGQQGAVVSAYPGANALILNAKAEVQQRLIQVIESLDTARAQVLVEAIIVEVSENAAKELGLQYVLAGGDSGSIPFSVTNYTNTAPNILATTGAALLGGGLDGGSNGDDSSSSNTVTDLVRAQAVDSLLGLNGFALGAAGRIGSDGIFGVILNALASDTDSNILSTPSILTLDNEAASFLAGQEIPITTGEALGSANANPFRTIDRKNVGVQMEVKPQISEDAEIRLQIRQEISSISGPVGAGSSELITNKREINTTVQVRDGEIVVLGGLIEQNESITLEKVPLLGDIPVIGRAFRNEAKSRSKRNLMIFLRPTIVRDGADMKDITDRKYEYMTASQRGAGSKLDMDRLVREALGRQSGS